MTAVNRERDTIPAPEPKTAMSVDDDTTLRRGMCTVLSLLLIGIKNGINPHYKHDSEWLELADCLEEQARIIRDTCKKE
jgi:hypothetical protein